MKHCILHILGVQYEVSGVSKPSTEKIVSFNLYVVGRQIGHMLKNFT